MGDHTESFQVDYDPTQISYDDLLELFWAGHDPTRKGWSKQYRSAVWYHDAEQHTAILASKARWEAENGRAVVTPDFACRNILSR